MATVLHAQQIDRRVRYNFPKYFQGVYFPPHAVISVLVNVPTWTDFDNAVTPRTLLPELYLQPDEEEEDDADLDDSDDEPIPDDRPYEAISPPSEPRRVKWQTIHKITRSDIRHPLLILPGPLTLFKLDPNVMKTGRNMLPANELLRKIQADHCGGVRQTVHGGVLAVTMSTSNSNVVVPTSYEHIKYVEAVVALFLANGGQWN